MWGEFEDSEEETKGSGNVVINERQNEESSHLQPVENAHPPVLPLRDRIIRHIASSSLTLKSQQRYESDLSYEERETLAAELLQKPGIFLYRFGKHLQQEHFQYFLKFEGDPEVDYYVAESLKHLNTHTAKITVRNRRYAAMQELRRHGTYFSEKEMGKRDPLLYAHLIARHQTEEEKEKCEQSEKDDSDNMRFSSLLLKHIDNCSDKCLKQQQEEEEDDMLEEDDDSDGESDEEGEQMEEIVESGEKQLFKEEFYSSLYHDFLRGKDSEFDYGRIDASDAYDLLDIRARDEEERYFDEDDDGDGSPFVDVKDADDSIMCCG